MNWQPQEQALSELARVVQILVRTDRGPEYDQAWGMWPSYMQNPEFPFYASYMFAMATSGLDTTLRQTFGLQLKERIKHGLQTIQPEAQDAVKTAIIVALRDPEPGIRGTAGTLITSIASSSPFSLWTELLPQLVEMLGSGEPLVLRGALNAIVKLCEDSGPQLDSEELGRPLNLIIPRLLALFGAADPDLAGTAVSAITFLLPGQPTALMLSVEPLLQALSPLAQSPNAKVRQKVCTAILTLLEVSADSLLPVMPQVCEFMTECVSDANEEVAMEAGEFFHALCLLGNGLEGYLEPGLPTLVPKLLARMVYSDSEKATFMQEPADNADIPDRPEDIRPMFHRAKTGGSRNRRNNTNVTGKENADDGSDDDDGRDDEEVSGWSVRKSAAAALDAAARVFGPGPLLPVLLPRLSECFSSNDPWLNESGILALGAVAEGCGQGLEPHLQQLFPHLIQQTMSPLPQLRSTACWSLSTYAWWAAAKAEEEDVGEAAHSLYVQPMTYALLERVLDRNKAVQEAACCALSASLDACGTHLSPFVVEIATTLGQGALRFQTRSLIVLWDSIGSLADCVGSDIARPDVTSQLLPPLLDRLQRLNDFDRLLFPLLECLASVAKALGTIFADCAPVVYMRCLRIAGSVLAAERHLRAAAGASAGALSAQEGAEESEDPPDPEFLVCALDVLAGMAEGLGLAMGHLADRQLLEVLLESLRHDSPEVRQSGFALLGDMARGNVATLGPVLPQVLHAAVENIAVAEPKVGCNASWSFGEVCVAAGREHIAAFAAAAVERLAPMLSMGGDNGPYLRENAAITLGRIAVRCREPVAAALSRICKPWCRALMNVTDRYEKEQAFHGLCQAIAANPQAAADALLELCFAAASWYDPEEPVPEELRATLEAVLQQLKRGMGARWEGCVRRFAPDVFEFLVRTYRL